MVSFPDEKRSRYRTDTLKAVVLDGSTVLCFAGDVHAGLTTIRKCVELLAAGGSRDGILTELSSASSNPRRVVEFLLVQAGIADQITRVSQGQVEPKLVTAWIGDATAFSYFQAALHARDPFDGLLKDLPANTQTMSRLSRAMDAIIADPRVDSVGNVAVRVALTKDGFTYLASAFTVVERDFTLETKAGEWTDIPLVRPVAEGGFAVSVVAPAFAGTAALGLSFPQPQIAMLYLPLRFDGAEVIFDVSPNDFSKVVLEKYGVAMSDPVIRHT